MTTLYRIKLNGLMPGHNVEDVANKLAALFKLPVEKVRPLLAKSGTIVKAAADIQTAAKYQVALEGTGCNCLVEAEGAVDQPLTLDVPPPLPGVPPPPAPPKTTAEEPRGEKKVSVLLGLGIFFLPYVFSWFTLMKGYSNRARAISLVWLVVALLFAIRSGDVNHQQQAVKFTDTNRAAADPGRVVPSNSLEEALQIGNSTRAQFTAFSNAGGLEAVSLWRGFVLEGVSTAYEGDKLVGFELEMRKKALRYDTNQFVLASVDNLKAALGPECGNQWEQNARYVFVASDNVVCSIEENAAGRMHVSVLAKPRG